MYSYTTTIKITRSLLIKLLKNNINKAENNTNFLSIWKRAKKVNKRCTKFVLTIQEKFKFY